MVTPENNVVGVNNHINVSGTAYIIFGNDIIPVYIRVGMFIPIAIMIPHHLMMNDIIRHIHDGIDVIHHINVVMIHVINHIDVVANHLILYHTTSYQSCDEMG